MKNISPLKMVLCTYLLLLVGAPLYADSEHSAATRQSHQETNPDPPKATSDQKPIPPVIIDIKKAKHLQEDLRQAQEIQFYKLGDSAHPFAVVSEQSNPHMFHLIKQTLVREQNPLGNIPSFRAMFLKNGKSFSGAFYSPEHGILDGYGQRAKMSDEVADWLLSQISQPGTSDSSKNKDSKSGKI